VSWRWIGMGGRHAHSKFGTESPSIRHPCLMKRGHASTQPVRAATPTGPLAGNVPRGRAPYALRLGATMVTRYPAGTGRRSSVSSRGREPPAGSRQGSTSRPEWPMTDPGCIVPARSRSAIRRREPSCGGLWHYAPGRPPCSGGTRTVVPPRPRSLHALGMKIRRLLILSVPILIGLVSLAMPGRAQSPVSAPIRLRRHRRCSATRSTCGSMACSSAPTVCACSRTRCARS
jgi:hypothetical protein